mmetsp:Transcript_37145/g.107016  ORF Transcript_37145/g.107016 Transcript_37145/m.107016 type:complete len:406 (+) Transcript_37145:51-1268(+)
MKLSIMDHDTQPHHGHRRCLTDSSLLAIPCDDNGRSPLLRRESSTIEVRTEEKSNLASNDTLSRTATRNSLHKSSSFACFDPLQEERSQRGDSEPRSQCSQEARVPTASNNKQSDSSPLRSNPDDFAILLDVIDNANWAAVMFLLEQNPALVREKVTMVVQGENSKCSLVHLLCSRPDAPVPVLDFVVTLHPSSLLQKESRAGRLPIHVAVVKDAVPEVIDYLCKARPQALQKRDQEGNLPIHYAAMHGSPQVLRNMLAAYPQACAKANSRDRFPIHLVCARCYDETPIPPSDLEAVIEAYPEALLKVDRFGRTPLHLAAGVQHPQWQILQVLIAHEPSVLLIKDKARKLPINCAKGGHNKDNDLVVTSLTEATQLERKKRRLSSLSWNIFSNKKDPKDLYCCYG